MSKTLIPFQIEAERVIQLRADEASRFLGRDFAEPEIVERLTAYGFIHRGKLSFQVPPHRLWDVESEEDLFEEVARSVGFNPQQARDGTHRRQTLCAEDLLGRTMIAASRC